MSKIEIIILVLLCSTVYDIMKYSVVRFVKYLRTRKRFSILKTLSKESQLSKFYN